MFGITLRIWKNGFVLMTAIQVQMRRDSRRSLRHTVHHRAHSLRDTRSVRWVRFLLHRGAFALLAASCLLFEPVAASDSVSAPFPRGSQVLDLKGKQVDPFAAPIDKAVVFIFASVECPIANGYMPEYRRLAEEFGSKGVVLKLVFPNPDESAAVIRKHLETYKCALPALRDPKHELVKLCKASVTPEAALFARDRGLVYHGRIDDRHAELGKTRPEATQHDLRDAIRAVLQGKSPEEPVTRAVGCYIGGVP
jgi:hypothetical protein